MSFTVDTIRITHKGCMMNFQLQYTRMAKQHLSQHTWMSRSARMRIALSVLWTAGCTHADRFWTMLTLAALLLLPSAHMLSAADPMLPFRCKCMDIGCHCHIKRELWVGKIICSIRRTAVRGDEQV